MKSFILALTFLATTLVYAGEIKVATVSKNDHWGLSFVNEKFEFNPELGRAWVLLSVYTTDAEAEPTTMRVQVEGLSFDKNTNSVVLDAEGKLTTCAEYKTVGSGIFRRKELVMSKSCQLKGSWRTVSYDDGYEIKKVELYDVVLITE